MPNNLKPGRPACTVNKSVYNKIRYRLDQLEFSWMPIADVPTLLENRFHDGFGYEDVISVARSNSRISKAWAHKGSVLMVSTIVRLSDYSNHEAA
jgi:hypothetical protein